MLVQLVQVLGWSATGWPRYLTATFEMDWEDWIDRNLSIWKLTASGAFVVLELLASSLAWLWSELFFGRISTWILCRWMLGCWIQPWRGLSRILECDDSCSECVLQIPRHFSCFVLSSQYGMLLQYRLTSLFRRETYEPNWLLHVLVYLTLSKLACWYHISPGFRLRVIAK